MDTIDLDYTHLGHAEQQRDYSDLGRAPGLGELIMAVHPSFGLDGKTLFVHVELPDGISRVYSFSPGQPVSVTDTQ